ncbi:hypothetical protein [Vibrio parahaemolyticus]|uniref:hypothetical protein n=1 Tax=Vibrio parahaemolyticus TaxID=670 RepID=UPI0015C4FF74|nr:hypothetical protein [Vibrio parahaemolyticus]
MIQEPTDSTFLGKTATGAERCLKAKNKLLLVRNSTNLNFSKYRLSINSPFPHFATENLPRPNAIFNEATSRILACFTVGVIQEFKPKMLICRNQKNELPKRFNLEKPKNFTLSHNALLRGEQRNTEAAAYHLNH